MAKKQNGKPKTTKSKPAANKGKPKAKKDKVKVGEFSVSLVLEEFVIDHGLKFKVSRVDKDKGIVTLEVGIAIRGEKTIPVRSTTSHFTVGSARNGIKEMTFNFTGSAPRFRKFEIGDKRIEIELPITEKYDGTNFVFAVRVKKARM